MKACALSVLLIFMCGSAWAIYGVRISDLGSMPVPPNPIRVWGQVTSESPLKLSDGRAEVAVTGLSAGVGDFLILVGDWNATALDVTAARGYVGTAKTEMIYIPAGSFLMGNNGSEQYSFSNELPQHEVYLSGYWIGKYEITRGEYAQFMAAGGYSNPAYWSTDGWNWRLSASSIYPSVGPPRTQPDYWAASQNWGTPPGTFTQTDNHPVVGVTYYEAVAFCNWAGGHLPTEAQWEKAARWTGSYPNVYPWGNTWDAQKCNSWGDSLYPAFQTAPVGSYPSGAGPYGCHDMAGNVWEWVQDWYSGTYYTETPPGGWTDPQGPSSGTDRILRGGGWNGYYGGSFRHYRCAYRNYGTYPTGNWRGNGFRIAR